MKNVLTRREATKVIAGTAASLLVAPSLSAEDNSSILEAERLFWAVRTRVVSTSQKLNAEQIPTYDPIHMAGHESLGDFIFVRNES